MDVVINFLPSYYGSHDVHGNNVAKHDSYPFFSEINVS